MKGMCAYIRHKGYLLTEGNQQSVSIFYKTQQLRMNLNMPLQCLGCPLCSAKKTTQTEKENVIALRYLFKVSIEIIFVHFLSWQDLDLQVRFKKNLQFLKFYSKCQKTANKLR